MTYEEKQEIQKLKNYTWHLKKEIEKLKNTIRKYHPENESRVHDLEGMQGEEWWKN